MSHSFKQFDIWLAEVYFEDLPNTKKVRPVLVVDEINSFVLSLKITSHSPRDNFCGEYSIQRWKEAGLLKPSTIRTSKRLQLPKDQFLKKIGELHPDDRKQIIIFPF